MSASRLTKKGQATIPVDIRQHLDIGPGDAIEFVVMKNGTVVVQPAYVDVKDLAGILKKTTHRKLSISDMQDVIKSKRAGRV